MWLYNREQYDGYNIYSMKRYVDKKRLLFNIIVTVVTIITLLLVIYYIVDTSIRIKKSRQFVAQINELKKQQEIVEEQQTGVKEEIEIQKEIEEQAKIPKLTQEGKENLQNIYNCETKRAFLTFDDGPSQNTNNILNILNEHNIKATFFVLGVQVEIFPETTKRIYNDGHYIANHGYTHIYSSIYQSPAQVLTEYNQCNEIVANTIDIPKYNSHLFRFPGGAVGGKYAQIKKQAISLLEENNVLHVDWNSLTGDSEKVAPTEEYLLDNLKKTTEGKNSVVILMHDAHAKKITSEVLPKVIEYLREQGYEFKNFYDIIK